MIDLDISDFPKPFTHINGKSQLNVSRLDIARAGMTIGYPKLSYAIRSLGIFRFLELYFRSLAYLEIHNNGYRLNQTYYSLDTSEQRTISYFLGQSFTKLFAEKYLNCKQVDDFDNHKSNVTFSKTGKVFTPKVQLYKSYKNPGEPDLLGISNNDYHILEAKGYASGFKKSEFQHAINQVSIVNKINGQSPITKTACFFDLSNSFNGIIKDPDDEFKNINIEFDNKQFLKNYYSIFNLELQFRRTYWEVEINNQSYSGFRLFDSMYPRLFIGVSSNIFKQVNTDSNIEMDFQKSKESISNQSFSIGSDQIILIDTYRNRHFKFERKNWA